MAIYTNTAEGGTNGATVTVANSASSGTAFDQVTGSVTYSTSAAMHGTYGFSASADTQYTRWAINDTAVLLRVYFKISNVTNGGTPARLSFASGNPIAVSVMNAGNAGRIQLYSGSGLATSPSAITANTAYRAELYVKSGTGNAEVRCAIYEGDSTTPWWDSGLLTGRTHDTISYSFAGKYDALGATMYWDEVGAKTASDAVWGAWPYAETVVVAEAGNHAVVAPGSQFTLNGTGSTGAITSYAWTALWPSSGAPALSGASTSTATGTAGSEGSIYAYRLTVNGAGGATSNDSVNVLVTNQSSGSQEDDERVWNGSTWA